MLPELNQDSVKQRGIRERLMGRKQMIPTSNNKCLLMKRWSGYLWDLSGVFSLSLDPSPNTGILSLHNTGAQHSKKQDEPSVRKESSWG